jgi:two-component system, LytTR family, sensor kinase
MFKKIALNKVVQTHAFVWIVYTLYFYSLISYFYGVPFSFSFITQTILHRLGDVFLFYVNAFWILPQYFNKKKILILIISFFSSVLFYVYFNYLLEFYIFQFLQITIPNDKPVLIQVMAQSINQGSSFIIFSLGYYFSQRVIQQQKEIAQRDIAIAQKDLEIANQKALVAEQELELIKKEIELAEEREKNAILAKEKAQAEMAFLRAQINPHFLFNSLNLIYSKVITSTKEVAAESILDFSRMMQYATSTKMQEDTVDVDGEIGFVKDYIKLFKARNRQGAYIDFEEEGYFGSHRVVPMVLITMVENALKHGMIDDSNNPIIIRASLIDDFFVFMVSNPKNPYPNDIAGKGNTGVGIPNIIKRLDAVYKNGGFTLESEDLKDDYIVTFTVNYKLI